MILPDVPPLSAIPDSTMNLYTLRPGMRVAKGGNTRITSSTGIGRGRAALAVFRAAEGATPITGTALPVDGGWTAH